MRGKACPACRQPARLRITPAYAGKSTCGVMHQTCPWDHPRLCGEKFDRTLCAFCILGSPPPMRGKVRMMVLPVSHLGITPAYAGKSTCGVMHQTCPWDHPRLCGEKRFFFDCTCVSMGSPPPMRGKELSATISRQENRITPAYAGKRSIY